uniref:Uncharacterized protein n=1 Tax=Musa acuminata subsp. malaccensis TaxID=214687 RepID=A0A804L408_MUSAM
MVYPLSSFKVTLSYFQNVICFSVFFSTVYS